MDVRRRRMKAVFFFKFESRAFCRGKTSDCGCQHQIFGVSVQRKVPVSPPHVLAFWSRSSPPLVSAKLKRTAPWWTVSYAFSPAPWRQKRQKERQRRGYGSGMWIKWWRETAAAARMSRIVFSLRKMKRQQIAFSSAEFAGFNFGLCEPLCALIR
jgi:hypothetical protein